MSEAVQLNFDEDNEPANNAIVPQDQLHLMVANRDAALAKAEEAVAKFTEGAGLMREALAYRDQATLGASFSKVYREESDAYRALFAIQGLDPDKSLSVFGEVVDTGVWLRLVDMMGLRDVMDHQAKKDMEQGLVDQVPEVSIENLLASIEAALSNRETMRLRGIAMAFASLDPRFKSHDAFKIGSRVILRNAFCDWGHFQYGSTRDRLIDVERAFAVLADDDPDAHSLIEGIAKSRDGYGPRQSEYEGPYFRIKGFKNGNAHLYFTDDALVQAVNRDLAKFYGEVLPDAADIDADPDQGWRQSSAVSPKLHFYPTPRAVVERILSQFPLKPGSKVLEPSAGDGAIAELLAQDGCRVTAVEIDPYRCRLIERLCLNHTQTIHANFLSLPTAPDYDAVVMNPPFFRTHWMQHVRHAFEFLAPGGRLIAILPATAQVGSSKAHEEFRAWAKANDDDYAHRRFTDLPMGSFKESGTNINTVIFTMRKHQDA